MQQFSPSCTRKISRYCAAGAETESAGVVLRASERAGGEGEGVATRGGAAANEEGDGVGPGVGIAGPGVAGALSLRKRSLATPRKGISAAQRSAAASLGESHKKVQGQGEQAGSVRS